MPRPRSRFTPALNGNGSELVFEQRVRRIPLPEKVEVARPTGVGRALASYTIPIEGRDEWLAAASRLLA
jgi:hypothetical protein